ncbi:MAG: hypothetical protein WBA57_20355 [Elainellaceae cyanobacterium]
MSFFRSYIAPFLIILIFAIAMLAVSARIFLPSDLAAPAPIEDPDAQSFTTPISTVAIAQFMTPGLDVTPNTPVLIQG